LKVLFLRTIIVGITVLGVYIISSIKIDTTLNPFLGVVEGLGILYLVPILYVALTLILLLVSLKIIFGISNIFRTSRQAYRSIRGGGIRRSIEYRDTMIIRPDE
jgi:phosphoglycerol transferase MdoB-like AlkP superfamily enzyme